jgi:hypothetical protein
MNCWLWTGSIGDTGYGKHTRWDAASRRAVTRVAHRVVYEALLGQVPPGLELDHLCGVRSCVNPAHLEPVTRRENHRRALTPDAVNAARTACRLGHPFSPENTRADRAHGAHGASRNCRTCVRSRQSETRRRQRIEARARIVAHPYPRPQLNEG